MMENIIARKLRITGRVQGVGYRNWMQAYAQELGVDGWVRNRADGSVEALVVGEVAKIEALITAARRGPALAKVLMVKVEEAQGIVPRGQFTRKPTV